MKPFIGFAYFIGYVITFFLTFPEHPEAVGTAPFASDSWGDTLTYAILWPLFAIKYILVGADFLVSNGIDLLF